MSLGYSLGDFIAGANLTYRLIRALSETRGACMEYQEAMSELGALQQTFLQVGYLRPNDTLSQATINAAAYIVLSSVELIREFLRKTEKYRQRLSRAGSHNAVSDSWQKMGWVLFKREELKALKDALHLRVTNIGVLLSTAQIHGKIPSSVARYEEKNLQSKDKIPHSITRHEEKDLESSFHPKGHLSETERLIKENLPMTVEVTTQPLRSTRPSDIPTAYLEVDTKVDLPSKGADFQPTEDPEPVEHFLKEPELVGGVLQDAEPVGHVAEGSQHPSTNNVPSGSDETTQSEISTTLHKIPSSYVAVNGKWDLPSKEPIGSSIESLRAETPSQVKSSENITIDQSFPPPKPSITSANASPEEASKTSQKIHNIQPQDHKIGINVNGAKLLSQLEVFLRETGTLRKEQKPIKFKDAVGRKFSFPFELASTWAGIEALIRQAFLHVEGLGPHVTEGHYDLVGPNGEIVLPRVWETVIQPDWSISMHMWPIPEPSKPQWRPQSRYNLHHHRFTGGPPPSPPHNWPGGPPPGGERPPTGGGPGGAMTIVNLTRGSSRSKKSNSLGLMKKAKKLFKSTAYNEFSDSDSLSSRSTVTGVRHRRKWFG